jgi:hypothetical protein
MNNFKEQYKNICTGVYLYKNFLSKEEIIPIMKELKSCTWDKNNPHAKGLKTFSQYKQRILDSLDMPNAGIPDLDHCIRRDGAGMEPHVDIQNYANPIYLNEVEPNSNIANKTINIARYGFIIYLNDDYEGGEICYPEYNFCYKPNAGDLVIHKVTNIHAVKNINSGYRYTHSAYINDLFHVEEQAFLSIDFPDTPYIMGDPKFFYSLSHGESLNPALRKFQNTYVDKGEYC